MKLSVSDLEEFIQEEIDYEHTLSEAYSELDDISNSLDDDLDRLEDVINKMKHTEPELAKRLEVFFGGLLDDATDLSLFLNWMEENYNL